jgi:serine/threonine protein kinase
LLDGHVKDMPKPPSAWLNRATSLDLENVVMSCLSKNMQARPQTAEALDHALAECASAGTWTLAQAQEWWASNVPAFETAPATTMAEKTLVIGRRN